MMANEELVDAVDQSIKKIEMNPSNLPKEEK